MKKTKSYSLDMDLIEFVIEYQKKYNLGSESTALGRILLLAKMGVPIDGGVASAPVQVVQPVKQPVHEEVATAEFDEDEEENEYNDPFQPVRNE